MQFTCFLFLYQKGKYNHCVIHRGRNTRDENWLLCKGPTVFGLSCVLCHKFWTNYDLDLFRTSRWPSDLQFCERYKGRCQIMTRNCREMIGKMADSLLCPFRSIQFSPPVFLPLWRHILNARNKMSSGMTLVVEHQYLAYKKCMFGTFWGSDVKYVISQKTAISFDLIQFFLTKNLAF